MRASMSSGADPGIASNPRVPMYLNVYDLTELNGYVYWFGLGIFHSGVEAHGMEYAFGAHDLPTSGVFEVEPRNCPGFTYRNSVLLGTTDMTSQQFRNFVEHCADEYNGDTYHLIAKNCNHFTDDMCYRLTGKGIPKWVNRLARVGWFCNCFLPESLQVATVAQTVESQNSCAGLQRELKLSLGSSSGTSENGHDPKFKQADENETNDEVPLLTPANGSSA